MWKNSFYEALLDLPFVQPMEQNIRNYKYSYSNTNLFPKALGLNNKIGNKPKEVMVPELSLSD